ncbi:DinB superfamily protein [Fodinibius roseus]|uniref:DinB superfamily protein n=1 Tax=Fodinibius roseus TaxID=1194090 RepID=A0A1M5HL35_9BACT|nr:DinB family protein [Fodinibius roseus]SHG16552.1 DinB superfamily protein [Fodinibius roseus]
MKNEDLYKEAPEYCHYYFDLVETDNLLFELEKSKELTMDIYKLITPELENFSYEPGKWTIKEVLRHIIDSERVFSYRAFRFSRFDKTPLAGFDQKHYVENANQTDVELFDLQEDYVAVRRSTIRLFRNMTEEMFDFKASANELTYTPRTLGFTIVGHNLHHCNFIKEKYLNS